MGASIIALLAFSYSLWAIGGAGAEVVYWGFLLLLAGLPVYVWVVRTQKTVIGFGSTCVPTRDDSATSDVHAQSEVGTLQRLVLKHVRDAFIDQASDRPRVARSQLHGRAGLGARDRPVRSLRRARVGHRRGDRLPAAAPRVPEWTRSTCATRR